MNYDYRWPVTFIASEQTNKSSIIVRAIDNLYYEEEIHKEGHVFFEYGKKNISCYVYEPKERFKTTGDFRSRGCFIVYDITNRQSFDEVIELLSAESSRPVVLVGSNSDLDIKKF